MPKPRPGYGNLAVSVSAATASAFLGDNVLVTVRVTATGGKVPDARITSVRVGSSRANVSGSCSSGCGLGGLGSGYGALASFAVSVPREPAVSTLVPITVAAGSSTAHASGSGSTAITFLQPSVELPGGGTGAAGVGGVGPAIPIGAPGSPLRLPGDGVSLPLVQSPLLAAPQFIPGTGTVVTPIRLRSAQSSARPGAASGQAAWLSALLTSLGLVTLRLRLTRRRPDAEDPLEPVVVRGGWRGRGPAQGAMRPRRRRSP